MKDESIVTYALQQTQSDLGFGAFAIASSADESMAGKRRPDVTPVDIRLKRRPDGIKTAQRPQQRFGTPIVLRTAHATLDRAQKANPHGCLPKPAELRSAIEIALSRQAGEARPPGTGATIADVTAIRPTARDVRAPRAGAVRRELEQILGNADFDAPRRSREFLCFIVEETLAGRGEAITQTTLATEVFGRKGDFDAIVDPIVRIQAGRLRRSLERYYLLSGKQDPVRVELPKGSYAAVFRQVAPTEAASAATESETTACSAGDGWPVLVVSGFEATGPDPEAQELALQVRDDLALELGRYRSVRVRRHSDLVRAPAAADGGRFALDGHLRREGDSLRIAARLVDRITGEQVWGDEYRTTSGPKRSSGAPDDVAHVIAARVAAEEGIVLQLLSAERRKLRRSEPVPYDAVLLAYEFFVTRDIESFLPAVETLRRVVEAEPECAPAWTRLARLYLTDYAFELTARPTPIDQAITCAHRGVRLDPVGRNARCWLASALLIKGELAAGLEELEQALRLSPRSLVYLEIIGSLLTLLGDWERGAALSRSARERNPHCLPPVLFGVWADSLRRGDVARAYQAALEYRDPTLYWRSVMRASCLGLLGRIAEARTEVAEVLSTKPNFRDRGRVLIGHYIKFPEVMGPIVEGLARAGLVLA